MELKDFRENLESSRNTFEYRLDRVLYEFGENICTVMKNTNTARADLAKKMGVSPSYITKVLNGNPNLTLESILKITEALDYDFQIELVPKRATATVRQEDHMATAE